MAFPLSFFGSRKPPAGTPIDFGHDLARGLAFACAFNEEGSSVIDNAVAGRTGALSGTTKPDWTSIDRPGGLRFHGNATPATSYVDFGTDKAAQDLTLGSDGSTPMTILARVWAVSNAGIAERNNGNVSQGWECGLLSGTTPKMTIIRSSSNISLQSGGTLATGKWQTFAIVWNGKLNPTTAPASTTYINGRNVGTGTVASGAGVGASDAAQALRLGRASAVNAQSLNGSLDYLYIWRRMLSDGEIAFLEANPYAFFDDPLALERVAKSSAIGGSGGIVAPSPTVSGSGSTLNPITGTGAIVAPSPTVSGSGGSGAQPDAVVTQVGAEVFALGPTPDAAVTQAGAEVFGINSVPAVVTQAGIETFGIGDPPIPPPPGDGGVPIGIDPTPDDSMCGSIIPLTFAVLQTDGGPVSWSWVDQPINDATIQRQPRIVAISTLSRELSDVMTGAYNMSTGSITLTDYDGNIRAMIRAGTILRKQIDIYMVDDEGRRLGDVPMRVGAFLVVDHVENPDLTVTLNFEDRLGGSSSKTMLNKPLPFRTLTTDFNATLPPDLIGKGEPLPYGLLTDQPAGFPTVQCWYTGTRTLPDGQDWYEGLFSGCAVYGPIAVWGADGTRNTDGQLMQVQLPASIYDSDIAMPGTGAIWTGFFGTQKYLVYNGRRYGVMYFRPGSVVGEAFLAFAIQGQTGAPKATEAVPVHLNIGAIEDVGDGTGNVIVSIPRQVQHLITNFVEQNHATDADWYPIPVDANGYSIIDTPSVEATKTASEARDWWHDTVPGVTTFGYEGAWQMGWDLSRETLGTWLQRACLAGDFQLGQDRHGRVLFSMEDPAASPAKAFTVRNVLAQTYTTTKDLNKLANSFVFKNWKRLVQTNPSVTLRPTWGPQQTDWLLPPVDSANGVSITALGGDPAGRVEFDWEDWITRDPNRRIPVDVAAHVEQRLANGLDMHVLETDLCGLDVELGDNITITHDAGLYPTTARTVRITKIELDPPDPFQKTWTVRLTGYDITDFEVIP